MCYILKTAINISPHFLYYEDCIYVFFQSDIPESSLSWHGGTAERAEHGTDFTSAKQAWWGGVNFPEKALPRVPCPNHLGWKVTLLFSFPARWEVLETKLTLANSAQRDRPLVSQLWNVNNFCLTEYPPWFCQNPSCTTAYSSKR